MYAYIFKYPLCIYTHVYYALRDATVACLPVVAPRFQSPNTTHPTKKFKLTPRIQLKKKNYSKTQVWEEALHHESGETSHTKNK